MPTSEDLDRNTENRNQDGTIRIDATIVCRENRSTYRYDNNSQKHVAKIKVDGGLISDPNKKKCDWLLINWDDGISFFIELKGSDLFKAVSQITSTINAIWNDINDLSVHRANARIVLSRNRIPNYKSDSRYKKFDNLISQKYGDIRIESQQMQEQY